MNPHGSIMRLSSYRSILWMPVAFWLLAAMSLSALATEHILQPLRSNSIALNVARLSAYLSTAIIVVGVVALVLIWAVAARLALRWFKLPSSYRDVIVSGFGALWILGAYSTVGVVIFLVVHPDPLPLRGAVSWSSYMASAMRQEPVHAIAQGQFPLTIVALAAMCWNLRRAIRCSWADAALTVAVGCAMVGAAFYGVTIAARLIGRL